jgi:DNA-binding transcriptional LysR family regulator
MFPAMQLRQLEYLVALDRERHFGDAARACHVSQPALSTAIRALERELGLPLVRRSGRFQGFTEEGERVLVWARRALTDVQALSQEVDRLRSGMAGTLRLGAIPTSLSATTLVTGRFRHHHPRMRVELRSMSSREIAHGLAAGDLDAGLTYLDNEPLSDVDSLGLWRETYLLVSPASTLPPDTAVVGWREAAEMPLCLLTEDMQHRRIVDAAFAAAGARPDAVVVTNSISTLVAHARAGLAAVVAQSWLRVHPLPSGLRAVPLVEPRVEHVVGLVTAAGGQQSPVVAELRGLFRPLELDAEMGAPAYAPARASAAA